jgi:hypothetical protein
MSFDLKKIFEGKGAFHRDLAGRPIAEKLRMLDALRERELAIRGRSGRGGSNTVTDQPALRTKR